MKILITGGCGFIGSHLAEMLLKEGNEVVIIDNLFSGSVDNISAFKTSRNLTFLQADIRNRSEIEPHFEGVDWVFHLAGLADIVPSIESPDIYFDVNVTGTLNVLQASLKAGVRRFIYAASSSCYGIPNEYPTPETSKINPQYPYALTKYIGEELVISWCNIYRLQTVSLRLFNVYGPRSRTSGAYGAVFGVFLAQKLTGKPFTVVGDGTQTRDFTYVTDVATAFIAAAASEISGEIINVGSGGHYSINYLVSFLGGPIINIAKRPGEPDCTFADISKIKILLKWEPQIAIEVGINKMIECIDNWKDAPVWDEAGIRKATESWFKYLGK